MNQRKEKEKSSKVMIRKKTKTKVKPEAHEEDVNIASQLFEETIQLAEEEAAVGDSAIFAKFIVEMIPEDMLDELKALAGVGDNDRSTNDSTPDSINGNNSLTNGAVDASTFRFLEDVWSERFEEGTLESDIENFEHETNSYDCELCDRIIQTTRHHVYPKETHDWLRKKNESVYNVSELRKTIALCRMCHSAIHRFYTNRELAIEYHSLELLLESDQVCKFAKWASSMQGRGNLRTR